MKDREQHFPPEAFQAVPGDHQATKPAGVATPSGDGDGPVRDTPLPEPATAEVAEGAGTVPTVVFEQMVELQQQLEEAQAKAAKYDSQLEKHRETQKLQRQRDPEHVRALTNARVQRHRARKRQSGGM